MFTDLNEYRLFLVLTVVIQIALLIAVAKGL